MKIALRKIRIGFKIMPFLLLPLVIINWFSGWNYIYSIDGRFKLNPEMYLQDSVYFWHDRQMFGWASPSMDEILFFSTQTLSLRVCRLFLDDWESLVLSNFICFYVTVVCGFFFAFLFFREFFNTFFISKLRKFNESILLYTISILYTFNQYTLLWVFNRFTDWTLLWAGLPLIAYLFLVYSKTGSKKIFFFVAVITFLTPISTEGFNLQGLPSLIIVFVLLTLALMMYFPSNYKCYILRFCMFLTIFLLLNIWSLLPQVSFMNEMGAFSSYLENKATLESDSRFASILNIFRFSGFYALYAAVKPYYAQFANFPYVWAEFYFSAFAQIAMFIYPFIMGMSLLCLCRDNQTRLKKIYLTTFSFILISIFVMKGTSEPFPNFAYFLLDLHSEFFRHPYSRFISVFAFLYNIVLLYFLYKIFEIIKRKKISYFATLSIVLIIISLSYPLFTGDVIHPSDRINLSNTSYLTLQTKFDNADLSGFGKYRVLEMPFDVIWHEFCYNVSGAFHHPNANPLLCPLINDIKIIHYSDSVLDEEFLHALYNAMKAQGYCEFIDIAKFMNVGYIASHKDASDIMIGDPNNIDVIKLSPTFVDNLERERFITEIFEDGNIAFYRINNVSEELYPSYIYPSSRPVLIDGGIAEMLQLVTSDVLTADNNVFFLSDQTNNIQWNFSRESNNTMSESLTPTVNFEKVNPTKYVVKIENATCPFFLVLSESYNPQWKAYTEDKLITNKDVKANEANHGMSFTPNDIFYWFVKPLPDENHLMANGYANAWYIDPKTIDGDGNGCFTITLYFLPQNIFYMGLYISGATFVGCIAYLFKDRVKVFLKYIGSKRFVQSHKRILFI